MSKRHDEKVDELKREEHIAELKLAGEILAFAIVISSAGGPHQTTPEPNSQQQSRVVQVLTQEQEKQIRSPLSLPNYYDLPKATGSERDYWVGFRGSGGLNQHVKVSVRPEETPRPAVLRPSLLGKNESASSLTVS